MSDRAQKLGNSLLRPRKLDRANEQLVNEYFDAVEAAARAAGLVQVLKLRQPQVFRWLAAHQVCGWTPRQIAMASRVYKDTEAYHNTVVHGIKKLRADIGLTSRKDYPPSPRRSNLTRLVEEIPDALDGKRRQARNKSATGSRPVRTEANPEEELARARAVIEVLRRAGSPRS